MIGSTLAGDSLLIRLRSTSIGLLGLVAATGLGLIAFASNQGWTGSLDSPLPASPPSIAGKDAPASEGAGSTAITVELRKRRGVDGAAPPREGSGRSNSDRTTGSGRLRGADAVTGPPDAPPVRVPPSSPPPTPTAGEPSDGGANEAPAATPTPTAPSPAPSATKKPKGPKDVSSGVEKKGGTSKVRSAGKAAPAKRMDAPPAPEPSYEAPSSGQSSGAKESPGKGHAYGKSGKS